MNDLQTLFLCCAILAALAVFSLVMWVGANRRVMMLRAENSRLGDQVSILKQTTKNLREMGDAFQARADRYRAENAALRAQIPTRGAGGKFSKKIPGK